MELLPADYVLCALMLIASVLGMFRGFSGTLAFIVAFIAGGVAASFVWKYSLEFSGEVWIRSIATLVSSLLVFGIVRIVVKKLVNGLLAQPADALYGLLFGAGSGALVAVLWAWSGMFLEYSNIASAIAAYLPGASNI